MNKTSGRSLDDILNGQKSGYRVNGRRRNNNRYSSSVANSVNIKIKPYNLEAGDFPDLVINSNDNNSETNSERNNDYKRVVVESDFTDPSRNTITNSKGKPGWTTIDKKTRQITSYDNYGNVVYRNNTVCIHSRTQEIYKIYQVMSDRWNNYYDETNELLGDRSPYINYQSAIDQIVHEDNISFKKCYHDYTDYSSGDDDAAIV